MKMDGPVRYVVIGTGMIARFHVAAIRSAPGAELAGICGSSPEKSEMAARTYQTRAYRELEEVWADPAVDAVCVCTPSGLHAPIALQAVEHGRHVLIEKPMALTLRECGQLIDAARERGVHLGVVSQLRFSEAAARVRRAMDGHVLGRLVSADLYMKYYRSQEYYDSSGWRGRRAMDGGGALMNQGIHGVDLLQYLAGPVASVFAQAGTLVRKIEVEDTLSAVVTFRNGALGVIQATTSVCPGFPRRLELCGEKGTIILEEDTVLRWDVEGMPCTAETGSQEHEMCSSSDPAQISLAGHQRQLANFTAAILGREPLLIDGTEGRKAVELILAAYRSVETGRAVELPYGGACGERREIE